MLFVLFILNPIIYIFFVAKKRRQKYWNKFMDYVNEPEKWLFGPSNAGTVRRNDGIIRRRKDKSRDSGIISIV